MTRDINIKEIRAELLLDYLYPEISKQWIARCEGSFFRNYSRDAMEIDAETSEIRLSRDGFINLLPQGLITQDEDLKEGDFTSKYQELQRRKRLLRETFLPLDTYFFQKRLLIEHQTSELLRSKLSYLLKEYFDYDIEQESSDLVRQAAMLLPYVSTWRGDFGQIRNMLSVLLKCRVTIQTGRYSHLDTTICWLPKVRYELLIPGLTPEEYRQKDAEIEPLRQFIKEWFIPFDVWCEIVVKDGGYFNGDESEKEVNRLTIGYNTRLNSEE